MYDYMENFINYDAHRFEQDEDYLYGNTYYPEDLENEFYENE